MEKRHDDAQPPLAMVGAQLLLQQKEYLTTKAFQTKLDDYMKDALKQCPPNTEAFVVFPELIGTWLIIADHQFSAENTVETMMLKIILRHPVSFIFSLFRVLYYYKDRFLFNKNSNLLQRALFQMQSQKVLNSYYSVFRELAIKHNSWIVAGSVFLPKLRIENKKNCPMIEHNASLYNLTCTFSPEGYVADVAYKSYLVEDEQKFLDAAPDTDFHWFDCGSFGRASVLICADSWFPNSYNRLFDLTNNDNIETTKNSIIAVPTFTDSFEDKWKGYCGWPAPSDVDEGDIDNITLHQAWRKYAVPGRCIPKRNNSVFGINTFFQGSVCGLVGHGSSIITHNNSIIKESAPNVEDCVIEYL